MNPNMNPEANRLSFRLEILVDLDEERTHQRRLELEIQVLNFEVPCFECHSLEPSCQM